MKITAIESQKKAPGRVNIFIDDKFSFGISEKLLIDYDLYKGKEVDEKDLRKYKEGDSLGKCLDKAYRFLSYRPRSEKEMHDKLLEKYDNNIVEETVKRLKEYNFLNDSDFAKIWVSERCNGRGKRALAFELKRKGIDNIIVEEVLSNIGTEDEYASALKLVKSRAKYNGLEKNEAYKKIAPFLSRRGYNYDVIKRVISDIL